SGCRDPRDLHSFPTRRSSDLAGYGIPTGAYGTPSQLVYASISQVVGPVTDADIFAAVDAVRPIATVLTVGISNVVTLNPLTNERSEEHTSELQSRRDLVCRLL